jgi:hypothetical protein
MPPLRRPSLFALLRAAIFLIAPIPAMRWWYTDAHYSIVERYFMHEASTPPIPRKMHNVYIGNVPAALAIEHGLERDMQLYNVQLWSSQNRRWSLRTCCFMAQSLGIVGAAGSLLQFPRRRRGHCPSCDYYLHGLSPDAQGHVRCPECGARAREAHPLEVRTTTSETQTRR